VIQGGDGPLRAGHEPKIHMAFEPGGCPVAVHDDRRSERAMHRKRGCFAGEGLTWPKVVMAETAYGTPIPHLRQAIAAKRRARRPPQQPVTGAPISAPTSNLYAAAISWGVRFPKLKQFRPRQPASKKDRPKLPCRRHSRRPHSLWMRESATPP